MDPIRINAKGKTLGRLSSRVAYILTGKHLATYRPERREGPHILVYNLDHIQLSGNKAEKGVRYRHSGYPGGLKTISVKRILEKDSRMLFRQSVRGMLAKNRLRAKILLRLSLMRGEPDLPIRTQMKAGLPVRSQAKAGKKV